jgi:hypothetical protein
MLNREWFVAGWTITANVVGREQFAMPEAIRDEETAEFEVSRG